MDSWNTEDVNLEAVAFSINTCAAGMVNRNLLTYLYDLGLFEEVGKKQKFRG